MNSSRYLLRSVAAALAFVVLFTHCLFAHLPEKTLWDERRAGLPRAVPVPAVAVAPIVWSQFGTVRGQVSGTRNIIHIQDVHLNLEAQQNIGRAVAALVDNGQTDLIALEGAFEPIDLAAFHDFPYPPAIQKAADYLLKEGKISGPIHALMVAKSAPRIVGIDDQTHYDANVAAVRAAMPQQQSLRKDLAAQTADLNTAKERTFNPELLAFDRSVEKYRGGEMGLGEYLSLRVTNQSHEIAARPAVARNDIVARFVEAYKLEQAQDLKAVEIERAHLVARLSEKISATDGQMLLSISAGFKAGRLTHAEFYRTLENLCRKAGLDLKLFPAMADYLRYVALSDSINVEQLLEAVRAWEIKTYATLAHSPAEKELIKKSRDLYLRGKLIELALTKPEWEEFKSFAPPQSPFSAFYFEAEARDTAMAKNLQAAIKKYDAKNVVLVTGGFHANGIKKLLPQNLVTFTPHITKLDTANGSAYLSVFTAQKTPLEELFEGQKLFLAEAPGSISARFTGLVLALVEGFRAAPHLLPRFQDWAKKGLGQAALSIRSTGARVYEVTIGTIVEVRYDEAGNFAAISLAPGAAHKLTWGLAVSLVLTVMMLESSMQNVLGQVVQNPNPFMQNAPVTAAQIEAAQQAVIAQRAVEELESDLKDAQRDRGRYRIEKLLEVAVQDEVDPVIAQRAVQSLLTLPETDLGYLVDAVKGSDEQQLAVLEQVLPAYGARSSKEITARLGTAPTKMRRAYLKILPTGPPSAYEQSLLSRVEDPDQSGMRVEFMHATGEMMEQAPLYYELARYLREPRSEASEKEISSLLADPTTPQLIGLTASVVALSTEDRRRLVGPQATLVNTFLDLLNRDRDESALQINLELAALAKAKPTARRYAMRALDSEQVIVVIEGVITLEKIGHPDDVSLILQGLRHPDKTVRLAAVNTISRIYSQLDDAAAKRVADSINSRPQDPDTEVQAALKQLQQKFPKRPSTSFRRAVPKIAALAGSLLLAALMFQSADAQVDYDYSQPGRLITTESKSDTYGTDGTGRIQIYSDNETDSAPILKDPTDDGYGNVTQGTVQQAGGQMGPVAVAPAAKPAVIPWYVRAIIFVWDTANKISRVSKLLLMLTALLYYRQIIKSRRSFKHIFGVMTYWALIYSAFGLLVSSAAMVVPLAGFARFFSKKRAPPPNAEVIEAWHQKYRREIWVAVTLLLATVSGLYSSYLHSRRLLAGMTLKAQEQIVYEFKNSEIEEAMAEAETILSPPISQWSKQLLRREGDLLLAERIVWSHTRDGLYTGLGLEYISDPALREETRGRALEENIRFLLHDFKSAEQEDVFRMNDLGLSAHYAKEHPNAAYRIQKLNELCLLAYQNGYPAVAQNILNSDLKPAEVSDEVKKARAEYEFPQKPEIPTSGFLRKSIKTVAFLAAAFTANTASANPLAQAGVDALKSFGRTAQLHWEILSSTLVILLILLSLAYTWRVYSARKLSIINLLEATVFVALLLGVFGPVIALAVSILPGLGYLALYIRGLRKKSPATKITAAVIISSLATWLLLALVSVSNLLIENAKKNEILANFSRGIFSKQGSIERAEEGMLSQTMVNLTKEGLEPLSNQYWRSQALSDAQYFKENDIEEALRQIKNLTLREEVRLEAFGRFYQRQMSEKLQKLREAYEDGELASFRTVTELESAVEIAQKIKHPTIAQDAWNQIALTAFYCDVPEYARVVMADHLSEGARLPPLQAEVERDDATVRARGEIPFTAAQVRLLVNENQAGPDRLVKLFRFGADLDQILSIERRDGALVVSLNVDSGHVFASRARALVEEALAANSAVTVIPALDFFDPSVIKTVIANRPHLRNAVLFGEFYARSQDYADQDGNLEFRDAFREGMRRAIHEMVAELDIPLVNLASDLLVYQDELKQNGMIYGVDTALKEIVLAGRESRDKAVSRAIKEGRRVIFISGDGLLSKHSKTLQSYRFKSLRDHYLDETLQIFTEPGLSSWLKSQPARRKDQALKSSATSGVFGWLLALISFAGVLMTLNRPEEEPEPDESTRRNIEFLRAVIERGNPVQFFREATQNHGLLLREPLRQYAVVRELHAIALGRTMGYMVNLSNRVIDENHSEGPDAVIAALQDLQGRYKDIAPSVVPIISAGRYLLRYAMNHPEKLEEGLSILDLAISRLKDYRAFGPFEEPIEQELEMRHAVIAATLAQTYNELGLPRKALGVLSATNGLSLRKGFGLNGNCRREFARALMLLSDHRHNPSFMWVRNVLAGAQGEIKPEFQANRGLISNLSKAYFYEALRKPARGGPYLVLARRLLSEGDGERVSPLFEDDINTWNLLANINIELGEPQKALNLMENYLARHQENNDGLLYSKLTYARAHLALRHVDAFHEILNRLNPVMHHMRVLVDFAREAGELLHEPSVRRAWLFARDQSWADVTLTLGDKTGVLLRPEFKSWPVLAQFHAMAFRHGLEKIIKVCNDFKNPPAGPFHPQPKQLFVELSESLGGHFYRVAVDSIFAEYLAEQSRSEPELHDKVLSILRQAASRVKHFQQLPHLHPAVKALIDERNRRLVSELTYQLLFAGLSEEAMAYLSPDMGLTIRPELVENRYCQLMFTKTLLAIANRQTWDRPTWVLERLEKAPGVLRDDVAEPQMLIPVWAQSYFELMLRTQNQDDRKAKLEKAKSIILDERGEIRSELRSNFHVVNLRAKIHIEEQEVSQAIAWLADPSTRLPKSQWLDHRSIFGTLARLYQLNDDLAAAELVYQTMEVKFPESEALKFNRERMNQSKNGGRQGNVKILLLIPLVGAMVLTVAGVIFFFGESLGIKQISLSPEFIKTMLVSMAAIPVLVGMALKDPHDDLFTELEQTLLRFDTLVAQSLLLRSREARKAALESIDEVALDVKVMVMQVSGAMQVAAAQAKTEEKRQLLREKFSPIIRLLRKYGIALGSNDNEVDELMLDHLEKIQKFYETHGAISDLVTHAGSARPFDDFIANYPNSPHHPQGSLEADFSHWLNAWSGQFVALVPQDGHFIVPELGFKLNRADLAGRPILINIDKKGLHYVVRITVAQPGEQEVLLDANLHYLGTAPRAGFAVIPFTGVVGFVGALMMTIGMAFHDVVRPAHATPSANQTSSVGATVNGNISQPPASVGVAGLGEPVWIQAYSEKTGDKDLLIPVQSATLERAADEIRDWRGRFPDKDLVAVVPAELLPALNRHFSADVRRRVITLLPAQADSAVIRGQELDLDALIISISSLSRAQIRNLAAVVPAGLTPVSRSPNDTLQLITSWLYMLDAERGHVFENVTQLLEALTLPEKHA